MEGLLWRLNRIVDRAGIAGRVPLAEIVRLDVGVVAAHELPVDFVEVVGFEHHGGDDTLACRGLHDNFHLAEEEVEVCLDGGGVVALVYGEFSAGGAVVDDTGGRVPDRAGHGGGGEVDAVV